MSNLNRLCKSNFLFLEDIGYQLAETDNDNISIFRKEYFEIHILFDEVGYELSCSLVWGGNKYFTLQNLLDFIPRKGAVGSYQIGDKMQMEKGIKYLSDIIKNNIMYVDIQEEVKFDQIYNHLMDKQKESLKEYYFKTDMENAEQFWNSKQYGKVEALYEKYEQKLSLLQKQRLKYIKRGKKK